MKTILVISAILAIVASGTAQTTIQGSITDNWGNSLPGVNVFLKGTYDGTSSLSDGTYTFKTNEYGSHVIVYQCIGFENFEQQINLSLSTISINVVMKEKADKLEEVVISAGAFEASDKKKSVVLKPLDIVTTASSNADIYGTINCLPGASTSAEDGRLIVRGGEAEETKTFIDGLLMPVPYHANLPETPTRGKFLPFSFDGMMFSSGAYSAEYGDALSSIVNLNTKDESARTETQLMLMSVGTQINREQKIKKSTMTLSGGFSHLGPYFSLMQDKVEWEKAPVNANGLIQFRTKPSENSMLKVYAQSNFGNKSIIYDNINSDNKYTIGMKTYDFYGGVNFSQTMENNGQIYAGISYMNTYENIDIVSINNNDINKYFIHTKLRYKKIFTSRISIATGAESKLEQQTIKYSSSYEKDSASETSLNINSAFVESRFRITEKIASQTGLRIESIDHEILVLPRTSLAWSINEQNMFSFAYGKYAQRLSYPENEYLEKSSQAEHYVLNYQYEKFNRVFRIELFNKTYSKLPLQSNNQITTNGDGYAQGIDIFYRDETTIDGLEYWISYSFTNTERHYKDYEKSIQPLFVRKHSLSLVMKQYISKLSSFYGISYNFGSGLPYFHKSISGYSLETTPELHDISFNYTYIFDFFMNKAYLYSSVSNVLARKNIYGYEYKNEPSENGSYERRELYNGSKPFIIIALGVTL